MKKQKILIPGTLTVQRCIRIFVADTEAEARYQAFDTEGYFFDRPLRNGPLPDHDMVIRIIRRRFEIRDQPMKFEAFGPVIRSSVLHHGVIFAYQFVETTTVEDNRSRFGRQHENTETIGTSNLLSKKFFIFGRIITLSELKRLVAWVRIQAKLEPDKRNKAGFSQNGVSIYTPLGAKKILRKSTRHILKMGHATFVPFDRNTMELRPLE